MPREGRSECPPLGAWALPEPLPTGMPGLATRASIDRKSQPEQNTLGCHREQTGCRAAQTSVGFLRKRDL